ncbi:AbfB domain-containing protein [Jidongwangia harbinensis]|uniref:AbfB domain-containing protein n=1 Tax=Jidongwangia harbinensis TaxID=2878561 RepID=UPI001CDA441C|nr:AbfB domain-containing protein [Jidongwangia harbinensis]MCA2219538.1 AbfB domain-containing protein [Jidongwangia harbinensis]
MSEEDLNGPGVRVGGWVPPLTGSHPRTFPQHVPAPGPEPSVPPDPGDPVLIASHRRRTPWVGLAVLAVVALAGAVALHQGQADRRPRFGMPGTVILPSGAPLSAVPYLPPPPTETVAATTAPPSRPAVTAQVRRPLPTRSTRPSPAGPPVGTPSPPARSLTVGATVGLEPAGRPGSRVRHRDFVARIDRIGPGSTRRDRADAAFVVRGGLADPRCVSLESVNYPRHFLRHQNFTLRLHPRDRSALYAADATFCPVRTRDGHSLTLRSVNYPDRYLSDAGPVLRLLPAARQAPTTFQVRRPV